MSTSPLLISVGDDESDEDGANDAEEGYFVDHLIGRSAGQHTSAQHKKEQWLDFGFGFWTRRGKEADADESTDSAPRSAARQPRTRVGPRTASCSLSSTQNMASSHGSAGGSRMNTQRLLGHGRVLSIDRAAASGAPQRTKLRSSKTTATATTLVSVFATYGIPRICSSSAAKRARRTTYCAVSSKPPRPLAPWKGARSTSRGPSS